MYERLILYFLLFKSDPFIITVVSLLYFTAGLTRFSS